MPSWFVCTFWCSMQILFTKLNKLLKKVHSLLDYFFKQPTNLFLLVFLFWIHSFGDGKKKEKKKLATLSAPSFHIYFNLKAQIGSFVEAKDKAAREWKKNVKIHLNKSIFTFKRTQNMAGIVDLTFSSGATSCSQSISICGESWMGCEVDLGCGRLLHS